jgi:hypothetical protein
MRHTTFATEGVPSGTAQSQSTTARARGPRQCEFGVELCRGGHRRQPFVHCGPSHPVPQQGDHAELDVSGVWCRGRSPIMAPQGPRSRATSRPQGPVPGRFPRPRPGNERGNLPPRALPVVRQVESPALGLGAQGRPRRRHGEPAQQLARGVDGCADRFPVEPASRIQRHCALRPSPGRFRAGAPRRHRSKWIVRAARRGPPRPATTTSAPRATPAG